MLAGIAITPIGDNSEYQDSAERISALLESALLESKWINRCEGELNVTRFIEHKDHVIIKGICSGKTNGREFSIPFEHTYLISDNVSAVEWLSSPIFVFLLIVFRAFYNEQDPKKNAKNWRERSEFEIASKLEARINQLIDAPVEGVRLIWRYSLIVGVALFLLATTCTSIYAYTHPHPRNLNDDPLGRLVISLMVGALFVGVPAGLAGVFLGLTFIGREVEESVAGQSLLRFVGVQNAKALQIVSIGGAIFCLAGAAYFFRLLFF